MIDKAQSNAYLLIEQIEDIPNDDFYAPEEFSYWVDTLARLGEPAVDALLEKMPILLNSRLHYVGAHVFARVGYPMNSKALEFMVADVSNINSPSYEISLNALLKIGAPVLPVVEDALEYYRRDSEEWKLEIESLEDIKKQIR